MTYHGTSDSLVQIWCSRFQKRQRPPTHGSVNGVCFSSQWAAWEEHNDIEIYQIYHPHSTSYSQRPFPRNVESATNTGGSIGMAHPLFPIPHALSVKTGFTTSVSARTTTPHVELLALSDEVLGAHRISNRTTHHLVVPPSADEDHSQAWEAFFPEGCINPGNKVAPLGGFGFFLSGPQTFAAELGEASTTHTLFSYEVLFESGWEWRKGGKLPGICGFSS